MLPDDKSSKTQQPDSPFTPHDLIRRALQLSSFALGFVILVIIGNGLGDFLIAPIGIKENPPVPGGLVQFARAANGPVLFCFFVLYILKVFVPEECTSKQFFRGIAALVLGAALAIFFVVLIVGEVQHREFIPGTYYFWNRILPFIFLTILLLMDLFFAHSVLRSWKVMASKREKFGAVLIGLSAFPAVLGFIGFVASKGSLVVNVPLAILLFIVGVACIPKRSKDLGSEVAIEPTRGVS